MSAALARLDMSETKALNHEPIALLGLTQSEVIVVAVITAAIIVPLGIVVALLSGAYWPAFGGATVMLGGIGLGYVLATWVERQKADTPANFLMQTWALKVYAAPWVPKAGIYHFRRTGK